MTFTTRSGSRYEVQEYHGTSGTKRLSEEGAPGMAGRIRRLGGSREPTPRQGIDGRWREYWERSDVVVGLPMIVVWSDAPELPATLTSPVVEVRP